VTSKNNICDPDETQINQQRVKPTSIQCSQTQLVPLENVKINLKSTVMQCKVNMTSLEIGGIKILNFFLELGIELGIRDRNNALL